MDSNGETELGLLIRIAKSAGQAVWSDDNRFQVSYGGRTAGTRLALSASSPITGDGMLPGLVDRINLGFAKMVGPGFVPSWLKKDMTLDEIRLRLEVGGF